ncbi:MAG: DUF4082 domain-containing protein [Ignavibacteria bacterium]|nr:DUF4082 domain-containing protein [Ignavibacteria bacterium]
MINKSFSLRVSVLSLLFFSFTTFGQVTLFTGQLPGGTDNDNPYELGTKFQVSQVAKITAIRFYNTLNEAGAHTGNIWDANGNLITSVVFVGEAGEGWKTANLTTPLTIYPDNIWTVSVNTNNEYAYTHNGLITSVQNGIIFSVEDGNNGVFNTTPGNFPTSSFSHSNYFRDVVVEEVLSPELPAIALSWPLGGTQIYSNSQTFLWYLNYPWGAPVTYELNISTDPAMATYSSYNAGNQQQFTVNGLLNGTTYYWRVRVIDSHGWVINTSAVESFVSPPNAVTPEAVPSWPIGGPTVYTLNPTLFWYHNIAAFGLDYEIEVRQGDATALTGVANYTTNGNRYHQLNGLEAGKQYSWAVRSHGAAGFSAWSAPQTFTTYGVLSVLVPVPSWPVGDPEVYTTSPTLFWYLNEAGVGLSYDIEVVEGNDPFTGTPTATGIPGTYYQLANLDNGTVYRWKVRSVRGLETSDWSAEAQFHTYSPAPDPGPVVPNLSWPVGNTTVYNTSTTLSWWLGVASDGYTFDVEFTDGGALTGNPTVTGITSFSHFIPLLHAGKTYKWSVRSKKNNVYSAWAAEEEFTTISGIAAVDVPVPSWPIGDNTVYTTDQRLSWYMNGPSAGLTYNLRYSVNPDMSGAIVIPGISETGYDLSNLALGTSYYWEVNSSDGVVTSAWSPTASFVTWSGSWVVVPRPGSPAQGVYISSSAPTLTWYLPTAGNAVTGYSVQIADNPNFINAVTKQTSETNLSILTASGQNTVYWRVSSMNANGDLSAYSSTSVFSNNSPNSVNDGEIPTQFELNQNYPNPFNPSTTISFSVPKESFVTIKIYDVTGTLVKTLVSENKVVGNYKVTFDASALGSGVYFYRLEAGDVAITKKMMLLK